MNGYSRTDAEYVPCAAILESRTDDERLLSGDSLYLAWLVTKNSVIAYSAEHGLGAKDVAAKLEEAEKLLLDMQEQLNYKLRFYLWQWKKSGRVMGTGFAPENHVRRYMWLSPGANWLAEADSALFALEGRVVDMESATKDSFLVHMNLDYIAYDGIEFSSCLRRYMEAPWMRSSYLDCLILKAVLMQHLVIHQWRCGNYYERLNWTWNDLSKWNRRYAINVDKPSMRDDLRELSGNLSHTLSMAWKHYGLSGWVKSLVCNFIIPGSAAYYWTSAQTEPAAVAALMLSVGLMVQHHQSTVERISMYVPRSVHLNRAHQIRLNLRNILVRFEDIGVIDIEDVKQCLSSTRELGEDIPGYLFLLMRTSPGAGSGVVRARPAAKEIMGMSEGQSDASSK